MTPLVKKFYKLVKDAHKSHWFDIGDLQGNAVDLDAETLVYLPFPDITVVGTDKGLPFALHALTSKETLSAGRPVVAVAGFALAPGFIALPILSYGCSEAGDLQFWRKDGKSFDDVAQGMLGTLQHLVKSLDHGPRAAFHPEPVQSFTNQRKIAQGKPPSITWKTVLVQGNTKRPGKGHDSLTTGHASPRAHTRRGHWRNLQSGKKIWVRDCTVGDTKQGKVFHDYLIQPTKQENSNA
jgi:hypothetical protein